MLEQIKKLIDVKSIITLLFTICFVVLAINEKISPQEFNTSFVMILTYYFTRKTNNDGGAE